MTGESRVRILIVEDEDLVRGYIDTLVSALGYEVVAALPSAREALDLLAAGTDIDILLTDVVMPGGIDGRQLAERVLLDHPDIAILLVSGHDQDLSTLDATQAAGIAFLRKPFRKADLADALSALLAGRTAMLASDGATDRFSPHR